MKTFADGQRRGVWCRKAVLRVSLPMLKLASSRRLGGAVRRNGRRTPEAPCGEMPPATIFRGLAPQQIRRDLETVGETPGPGNSWPLGPFELLRFGLSGQPFAARQAQSDRGKGQSAASGSRAVPPAEFHGPPDCLAPALPLGQVR